MSDATTRDATLLLQTVWCREEPARVGQFLQPGPTVRSIGRDPGPDALPWQVVDGGQLTRVDGPRSTRVSRRQLEVMAQGMGVAIRNVGRRALHLNGEPIQEGVAGPGDVVAIDGEVAWRVLHRPLLHPYQRQARLAAGHEDAGGFVGDSVPLWTLRAGVARHGNFRGVLGVIAPPGTRPARIAHMLHVHAGRPGKAVRWEPADPPPPRHATVYLRSVQLPRALARLPQRSDLRWVVMDALGDEGWPILRMPGLDSRREDIPAILRARLLRLSLDEPADMSRYLLENGEVKIGLDLVLQLQEWPFERHNEELDELLWRSVWNSPRSRLSAVSQATNVRTAAWESFEDELELEGEPIDIDLDL